MQQRLNKALASCGIGSRRTCEKLILDKRVSINGQIITSLATSVDLDCDILKIDGEKIQQQPSTIFVYHKPRGLVCTSSPTYKGKKVIDQFPPDLRLFTVGRLDKETSGLIFVTNDGDFAHRLIHPSFDVSKEYLVKTRQEITLKHLQLISEGVYIEGVKIKPLQVKKVRRGTLKITVSEGKKHEVRLLIQKARLDLIELSRIRVGPFLLGNLPYGHFRSLSQKELLNFAS